MILLAQAFRDNLLESEHYGIIVKADANKKLSCLGDAEFCCFTRSLIKPIQAKVAKDVLGKELSNELLAIAIASHNAETEQLDLIKKFMSKFKINEAELQCGTYRSPSYSLKSKLEHNCSGKHSALIAACKKQDWSDNYMDLDHPIQIKIKEELNKLLGSNKDFGYGIDGCGLPSFHMSLKEMAIIFQNMLINSDYQEIIEIMQNYPFIIGGKNQVDSLLMHHSRNLIAKGGAEGLMMIGNIKTQEALVIKIIDGGKRAKTVISKALCKELDWLENDFETDDLIYNSNKEQVGHYAAALRSFNVDTSLT